MIDAVTIYDKLKAIQSHTIGQGLIAEAGDEDYYIAKAYAEGVDSLLKEIAAAISTVKIERRHVVHLELQGDTWDDVTSALDRIVSELQVETSPRSMTSGGVGAGYILFTRENKDQTHDRYVEQLRDFLRKEYLTED